MIHLQMGFSGITIDLKCHSWSEDIYSFTKCFWGYGGAVIKHTPPISKVGGSNPEPYVGNMVISYRWSAVYSTEP